MVDGRRIYDGSHACFYCGSFDGKINRHLQLHHVNENDIIKLKFLDVKTAKKERDYILDSLWFVGDFYYNAKVLKCGGELIVCRRPGPGVKAVHTDYGPCKYCLWFYSKDDLWRQTKRYPYKNAARKDNHRNSQVHSQLILFMNGGCLSNGGSLELSKFVTSKMKKKKKKNHTGCIRRWGYCELLSIYVGGKGITKKCLCQSKYAIDSKTSN